MHDLTHKPHAAATCRRRRFDNRHAVEEVNERFYRAFQVCVAPAAFHSATSAQPAGIKG